MNPELRNLTNHIGKVFHRLSTVGECQPLISKVGKRIRVMLCKCECGAFVEVRLAHLKNGNTKSCGCFQRDVNIRRSTKHGMRHTPEYDVWYSMIRRGTGKADRVHYFDRGIRVCQRWLESFEAFMDDMGPRPDGFTVERLDNQGDYCPENCVWASRKIQAENTRRTVYVTLDGHDVKLVDAVRQFGADYQLSYSRIITGWDAYRALTTPKHKNRFS